MLNDRGHQRNNTKSSKQRVRNEPGLILMGMLALLFGSTTVIIASAQVHVAGGVITTCRAGPVHEICKSKPAPPPRPSVESYSVSDIGKPGVPKLTASQLKTLHHILGELPPSARKRIRFVFSGGEGNPKNTFYVLDPGDAPPSGILKSGVIETFRVLNAPCSVAYDPIQHFVFTMTGCGPDPQITG